MHHVPARIISASPREVLENPLSSSRASGEGTSRTRSVASLPRSLTAATGSGPKSIPVTRGPCPVHSLSSSISTAIPARRRATSRTSTGKSPIHSISRYRRARPSDRPVGRDHRIGTAAAAERVVNAGLRRGSGTRIYGQVSNDARRNPMRPRDSSSRSPQGQPGRADTKRSPGRHPDVTHVPDTGTMVKVSERLEVPLEFVTTGQPQGSKRPRRRRVLVVADEADVAQLIRDNLLMDGWEIFTTGAAHVLEHVRDVRPDVVLLDIGMSQLDGWEVYRRLK